MPKFSGPTRPPAPSSAGLIRTTAQRAQTHEGALGWLRDTRSELFLLAVTNMVGEATFYESAAARDARFADLVGQMVKEDPEWLSGFLRWLRASANMRTAPLVAVAEAVKAGLTPGRATVASVLQRADEPAELLGYWLGVHGRNIPAAIKRGIADAAIRMYSEYSALKYDGQSRTVRMADVIELTHPKPKDDNQSALFRHLLDRRHNREEPPPPLLAIMAEDHRLMQLAPDERRSQLDDARGLNWSWERLAGWLPGGMDSEAWTAIIPAMGYMALLRNLRNFDEAGISAETRGEVMARLVSPEAVAKSRQFPYRFFSAWKAAPSIHWGPTLEAALEHSVKNVPDMPGKTLVLIDTSGSMNAPVSGRTSVQRYEIAALFGAALAKRCESVDVAVFADQAAWFPVTPGTSVLRYIEQVRASIGKVGYGTNIWGAVGSCYTDHDRVCIFTDEQAHDRYGAMDLGKAFVHTWNLAGYKTATMPSGPRRYSWGGFTDAMFPAVALVEAGETANWPWVS